MSVLPETGKLVGLRMRGEEGGCITRPSKGCPGEGGTTGQNQGFGGRQLPPAMGDKEGK